MLKEEWHAEINTKCQICMTAEWRLDIMDIDILQISNKLSVCFLTFKT